MAETVASPARRVTGAGFDAPAAAGHGLPALTLAALGVVYGDIGTSPLYTIRESFGRAGGLPLGEETVLGVLSLVTWALIVVVSLKYVVFIMRADNRGEGGILALTALALRGTEGRRRALVVALGMFGAALFYGDGAITPAISVLSAVEGLKVATPVFEPYVVPLAVSILVVLFLFQKHGTGRVGILFGPIVCVWFAVLGLLGLLEILETPSVLRALNPLYGLELFGAAGAWRAFVALGAVVLAVTGAEALYADMGHFGRRPIRIAWFGVVLPGLLLNYYGQGALVIRDPAAVANPFYLLAPSWGLYPMVLLATATTVIASQAVISGAFSLTQQAIQLGYLPRLEVRHTSERQIGQVYVPRVNWVLLVVVVALVLGFGSSSDLAAAYGIAVTGEMVITAVLAYVVARALWGWSGLTAGAAVAVFLVVDLAFFGATALKIPAGGWFPLILGLAVFFVMSTWKRGREALFDRLHRDEPDLEAFIAGVRKRPIQRVPGTAVFLTGDAHSVPRALLHNLKHNRVLHERVVVMTVRTEDVPWVRDERRVIVEHVEDGFYRVIVRYGFMEEPDVPKALARCPLGPPSFNPAETSFFLSRESFIPSMHPDLPPWREELFIRLSNIQLNATEFFCLPPDRVVELGTQVEI
jgi:KUP system potassium uptake protein